MAEEPGHALQQCVSFPGDLQQRLRSQDSWLVEPQTRDQKVVGSNPSRSSRGELSSPELTVCADSYSVSVPPPC